MIATFAAISRNCYWLNQEYDEQYEDELLEQEQGLAFFNSEEFDVANTSDFN